MIEIREIDARRRADINLPNEPFALTGRILPSDQDGAWSWRFQLCVRLAVLQPDFLEYMYFYDRKACRAYRRKHTGQQLIGEAKRLAAARGYRGLYTQGQDNNPGACLFYLKTGFYIGGLDTNLYRHTAQEGKADILFYCEADGPDASGKSR